ncbi:MAG: heme-dependent peroxidase [Bacillota bacterium]|nr:heme-dependent peroxidase [Bacillota bacterium]
MDGWFVLHDLRRWRWDRWQELTPGKKEQLLDRWQDFLEESERVEGEEGVYSALYRVVGHKADFVWVHFRPRVADLLDLERAWERTPAASLSQRTFSYLSVVELSRHSAPPFPEGVDPMTLPPLRERLVPTIPNYRWICFYPMSKRRGETVNWYQLTGEERSNYMRGHGAIGRNWADRVKQIVSGSMGLDDWEWGVSLFADEPLWFKKLVYEMRFDPASALFAEFGPFFIGERLDQTALRSWLR